MKKIKTISIDVVDPSFFTIPYDVSLCSALGEYADVVLVGRSLRKNEFFDNSNFTLKPFFFRGVSEELIRNNAYLKGAFHVFYMFLYTIYRIFFKVDVIHFQWLPIPAVDQFFIRLLRMRNKVFFTCHNTNAFHGSATSKLQSLGWRSSLNAFNSIQVHSQESKQKLINMGVLESTIFVSPHGILELDQKLKDDSEDLGNVGFLIYGQIKPYKDIETLLEAFLCYIKSGGEIPLTIVGRFSYSVECLKLPEYNNLIDVGKLKIINEYVSDAILVSYIKASKCCIFPYVEIDSSGALMLAVNYIKPVILSNLNGLIEPLKNGELAITFPVGDSNELFCCLHKFQNNQEECIDLAMRAYDYCNENYSWDAAAKINMKEYLL